ncbi:DNA primase catalytic core [Haloferula luteola]|uniref:DNA primase catalytic core n=1 Tax=Haloferula luteola TaxID=595692 RepID=A0A840VCT2_9BACT|nr:CHC2 zinc finger domain-containing protein [Haloferula luteola]MBB5351619.1 DNA primase catalytic core [Haloferula luteola]
MPAKRNSPSGSDNSSTRNDAINKLAAEANLSDVAEWLDLRVVGRGTRSPKTLCPYHEDQRPSMYLYPASGSGRPQFHCFSCGAHGDVFDLIKRQKNIDFRGALQWLADCYRVTLPSSQSTTRKERITPRSRGLEIGLSLYRRQTTEEKSALRTWASARRMKIGFLQSADVFAVCPPKISKSLAVADREQFDSLDAAGLILRESIARRGETVPLPVEMGPRDFYNSPRILFTIHDDRGKVAGFAGRSIGKELPKYLFSPGFPRGSTLYRFHKVRAARPARRSKESETTVHIFVVEGLMDSLRLEALGLHAVALLGSQITAEQVALLTEYARDLDRDDLQLAIHLLLDSDEAGRRGTVSSTIKLLAASVEAPGMLLDVLTPSKPHTVNEAQAHDPDEWFREVNDFDTAHALLSTWCESPMKILLAWSLEVEPVNLDSTWGKLPDAQRIQAFRDIERRLDRARWLEILDRVPAFECHLPGSPNAESLWEQPLRRFLSASRGRSMILAASAKTVPKDDNGRLIRALQIAEASTQRREFPVDEGSWDRLQAALDATIPYLRELLSVANDSGKVDADDMISVLVPKGENKFRLKALPSPEILTMQQYVLNELLREYADCPRFRSFIPGVRFSTSSGTRRLETTGADRLVPVGGETVSFAYTLDMDVIEHRAPPRRTGMFRSYFECWRDFISYIDTRVAAFPPGKFHVARLDVRSFYDTVTRPVVNSVLLPAVTDALAELADSTEENNAEACAKLFLPSIKESAKRAGAMVDWLCDQSFGYKFENPGSIEPEEQPHGLPQGPDLSAYLANISLFPLDRALSELVAKFDRQASEEQGESTREGQVSSVRGAVYARYVDDMVIIARSGQDLARLRTAIEQQLALVGMELSPKTEPLPVMDEAKVREWLTDRRGAGLGVSGPFEGPPGNAPLSLLEPLADAGETDRSDSLRILHDPRLDDPDTKPEELESAVEVILSAPESDLRHGDKAGAARLLWRSVIQEGYKSALYASDAAEAFINGWPRKTLTVSDLLAWLDGVERLLISRPDRNPTFSEQKHQTLRAIREGMAALVHAGLCEILIGRVIPDGEPSRFEHMLDFKKLVIRRAATLVQRPILLSPITILAGESRAKTRLLISLAEAQGQPGLMDRAEWRTGNTALGILFHESVARLRIANSQEPNSLDPLMPVSQSMATWRQRGRTTHSLENILNFWMPDAPYIDDPATAELALSSLINLAPKRAVDLISSRPVLTRFALNGSNGSEIRLIPTPPGLDVPGLLGLRDEGATVVRADFREEDHRQFCPTQLSWTENGGGEAGQWKRLTGSLSPYQYLPPAERSEANPLLTRWLAKAFRSLVAVADQDDQTQLCPPTASNLLGPMIGADNSESKWGVLGFCVPVAKVSAQAFLRQGDGGLVLEPVLELHDHLWRVGTALADWLGRAPSSRQLATQRLAAPALVHEEGEDWAREAMLRFSLCRLRGKSLPARPLRISPQTGLPVTVERVLKRLENFPSDQEEFTGNRGVAHLLATLAEGRAIQTRIDARIDPEIAGGATSLLAEMARGQFRSDEELAHHLPSSGTLLAVCAPRRRPARALFALSNRISDLAALDPMRDDDPTLGALASGTRLLSIELQLRSQALELWSLLDVAAQLKFQESPPSLADWNLDSTALLHLEQPSTLHGARAPTDWRNVRELFQKLHLATNEGQRVDWGALAGFTPLGWTVVLGALTGALSGDWRGGLISDEKLGAEVRPKLQRLAGGLALTAVDSDDIPWGGFEKVIAAWNSTFLGEAFVTLDQLDTATGLRVETHKSSRFYLEASRRRPTEVQASDGRRMLPGWAITWAKAYDESRGGIERVATSSGEDRVVFRWSETWRGDQLIGIGVVQPAMVALAGSSFGTVPSPSENETPIAASKLLETDVHTPQPINDEITVEPAPTDTPSQVAPVAVAPVAVAPVAVAPVAVAPVAVAPHPSAECSPLSNRESGKTEEDILATYIELEKMQDASWRSRGEKSPSFVRVALFQWEVDETYRHPGFDLCNGSVHEFKPKKPETWTKHSYGQSCAESRRRALLKAALKACNHFNVDVLLLPEYSVRPETVEWLSMQAPALAPKTSVWAGTYRLPPGMQKPTDSREWSAIHEVVLSDPAGKRISRLKRYPAAAANEVFHPGGDEMDALIEQKLGDAKSHIFELICSEVFLVTFPANLFPLARLRRDLLRKFGSNVGGKGVDDMIEKDVMTDIKKFAVSTAISENLGTRRTILLVPAMTSRTADYSVLGQAAFLSSGLTTVFCNAVCGQYGHGQSCFVGHNGWLDEKPSTGLPSTSPYHGPEPGIFHLDHENRGRLGKNEQALVIADIDPIYGAEGKPRPQTLLKPLQLVAHLPVIETLLPKFDPSPTACRCRRYERSIREVGEFMPGLQKVLKSGIDANWKNTSEDINPGVLESALDALAKCAGLPFGTKESNRGWLTRRKSAYLANHMSDPQPWPPPAALDWLWVDSKSESDGLPEIETPPYAAPPGGEMRVG